MNKLRPVGMEDMKDLYEWNNHPLSRKNSFRSDPITWEEHERWFKERMADALTTIYIYYSGRKKIGSVRFEEKQKGVRISVMLNPDFIGNRLGAELIRLGTELFMQEKKPKQPVIAEVKLDNLPSKKAFLRAGFKEDHIDKDYIAYIYGKKARADEKTC